LVDGVLFLKGYLCPVGPDCALEVDGDREGSLIGLSASARVVEAALRLPGTNSRSDRSGCYRAESMLSPLIGSIVGMNDSKSNSTFELIGKGSSNIAD
jgi:hypothetical protein